MGKDQQKILVIKLGALGDFFQALGPMAAIRKHHLEAHVTLLTTAPFEKFAMESGHFDEVLLDVKPKWFDFAGWVTLRRTLNAGGYSRVYDLQNNDRTSFYFQLLRGAKPEWVGVARGASHRNGSKDRTAGHAFDGHVQTLALAGITDIAVDRLEWMSADLSGFDLKAPYVLLAPGSAPQHPYKRWPALSYGALAQVLVAQGYQPVVLGTQVEAEIAAEIVRICPEALDLSAQTSLPQIVVLGRGAAGAVGNDTGPMHMIAPTGCPSLILFSGHSNPVRHAPKGEAVSVLQRDDLADLPVEDVLVAFTVRTVEAA